MDSKAGALGLYFIHGILDILCGRSQPSTELSGRRALSVYDKQPFVAHTICLFEPGRSECGRRRENGPDPRRLFIWLTDNHQPAFHRDYSVSVCVGEYRYCGGRDQAAGNEPFNPVECGSAATSTPGAAFGTEYPTGKPSFSRLWRRGIGTWNTQSQPGVSKEYRYSQTEFEWFPDQIRCTTVEQRSRGATVGSETRNSGRSAPQHSLPPDIAFVTADIHVCDHVQQSRRLSGRGCTPSEADICNIGFPCRRKIPEAPDFGDLRRERRLHVVQEASKVGRAVDGEGRFTFHMS
jgi:hypothetical protein